MQSIGRNDTISVPGLCTPTRATIRPSVAAMLYAGAVEETAITTLESSPSAPARRPLFWEAALWAAALWAAAAAAITGGAVVSALTRVVMGVYRLPPGPGAGAMAVLYLNTILLYRFWIRSFWPPLRPARAACQHRARCPGRARGPPGR